MTGERRFAFPPQLRLHSPAEFVAVYEARCSRRAGPLTIHAIPNDLGHPRLGLSIPRRAGNAARRNLVRRRLRESFRHLQHDLPRGYDIVIHVLPHEPFMLAEYQRLLSKTLRRLHEAWTERS